MNRAINLSLLCAALCANLTSQGQRLFDIGLKAALSHDDLSTDYSHTALLGGSAGLFARVKPPLLPGAQAEVLLTSVGTRVNVQGQSEDLRTLALQVPLFAVFSVGPVELHAGGYYERYLTKELLQGQPIMIEGQEVSLADLADDGYGAMVGAGLRLGHVYGGLRYNMGLDALGGGPLLGDVHSRQLQAYVGFGFVGTGD